MKYCHNFIDLEVLVKINDNDMIISYQDENHKLNIEKLQKAGIVDPEFVVIKTLFKYYEKNGYVNFKHIKWYLYTGRLNQDLNLRKNLSACLIAEFASFFDDMNLDYPDKIGFDIVSFSSIIDSDFVKDSPLLLNTCLDVFVRELDEPMEYIVLFTLWMRFFFEYVDLRLNRSESLRFFEPLSHPKNNRNEDVFDPKKLFPYIIGSDGEIYSFRADTVRLLKSRSEQKSKSNEDHG